MIKKLWNFIWNDDSLLSWIVNVILAFILVKFIIYPTLAFLLGTSFPVVAVVSCSMEHNAELGTCSFNNHLNFDKWWKNQEKLYSELAISKNDFLNYDFLNGFNKGDLMVLRKAKNIKKGDVIVFFGNRNIPIIHRVVNEGYITKGDNDDTNPLPDPWIVKRNYILYNVTVL